jgi:hypothetical protein
MSRMPAEIVLRSPTDAEFRRFVAPLSIAFNRRMTDAEIEADRRTVEIDRFVGHPPPRRSIWPSTSPT